MKAAASRGISALALTDHNGLSGAVRWRKLCASAGIKPILGAEVTMEDGSHLTLLAMDRRGYSNLCRLLTRAHLENERRNPRASMGALEEFSDGLICLSGCRRGRIRALIRRGDFEGAEAYARRLLAIFGPERFFIEMHHDLYPGDWAELEALWQLSQRLGVRAVAAVNVHYAHPSQFRAHDVLSCIRELVKIDEPAGCRPINAERWLKGFGEVEELFAPWPAAVDNIRAVVEMCEDYEIGGPEFRPRFPLDGQPSGAALLRQLALLGARRRYGQISEKLRQRIEHELSIIEKMGFVDYFLIVWDVVNWARERGIRYSGRGSCCDSVVAYALGITHVDAWRRRLRFERFINPSRLNALPDIDVDFDARRRDEVAEYVIQRYGPEHVAGVCTFQRFRARGALRETAKVLGLPEQIVERISQVMPHMSADALPEAVARLPELKDSGIEWDKLRLLVELAAQLEGLPRHIGTHLGGLVISARPLVEISPLQMAAKGIRIIGFDKEDVEELGLFKLDLLALRTLGAVDDTVRFTGADYENLPLDDSETFKMLQRGDSVGAFQLESPAQRSLHQRLQPDNYEDIVASVALIRPGPVMADMVRPFIRRRRGEEPVQFSDPRIQKILGKTYGVVLFQEQVIELAIEIAGFSPGEADELRRLMTHHRDKESIQQIADEFMRRALARGASREVAEMAFNAIKAFAGYGFCEGHAAAFGDIGYRTAYLLRHYPAQFYAALLNNQPMGFYPPHTLIVEARRRGVKILPLDINESQVDYTAGDGWLRVGLKQVKGIREPELEAIERARRDSPFASLGDFLARTGVARDTAENLILAGAFDSVHPNRRALIFQLARIGQFVGASAGGLAKAWIAGGGLGELGAPQACPLASCENASARFGGAGEANRGAAGPSSGGRASPAPAKPASIPAAAGDGANSSAGTAAAEDGDLSPPDIEDFTVAEKVMHEWNILGFSLTAHPLQLVRQNLRDQGVLTAAEVARQPEGKRVKAAGIVICPHRPPTRSGKTVIFLALEDETGLIDVTIFEDVYHRYGGQIFSSGLLLVEGKVQRSHGLSITAETIHPLRL